MITSHLQSMWAIGQSLMSLSYNDLSCVCRVMLWCSLILLFRYISPETFVIRYKIKSIFRKKMNHETNVGDFGGTQTASKQVWRISGPSLQVKSLEHCCAWKDHSQPNYFQHN